VFSTHLCLYIASKQKKAASEWNCF
jgi:hypothetical protein